MDLAVSHQFQLGRCIYQRDKQVALIHRVLENLLDIVKDKEGSSDTIDLDLLFNEIEADMLRIAALLKHPSFAEEDEWRLVSPAITDYFSEPVHFREGKSMMIPYYAFPLVSDNESRGAIPIEHVFVGPTPNSILSLNSIRLYLQKNGVILGKKISYCDIPYRNR